MVGFDLGQGRAWACVRWNHTQTWEGDEDTMQRPVPQTISHLGQDHLNARRALSALEREIDAAAQYYVPDFEIVLGAIAFFEDYADRHHAIEEMVYEALRRRTPFRAAELGALQDEHREAGN